jgi:predicted ATPase
VSRQVVISGCSGGGKSTLVRALADRGHGAVDEPGRRIVREELAGDGAALPWIDGVAFARRAVAHALADRAAVGEPASWVFFDRSLIDAAAALERITGEPALEALAARHRYHRRVFFTPPWPEIFVADHERRHGFETACVEYDHLCKVFPALGYEIVVLPKVSISERVEIVLAALPSQSPL